MAISAPPPKRPLAVRAAAVSTIAASVVIFAWGCKTSGEEVSFECKCRESEDTTNVRTMSVCAPNEHGAICAAKKCQGTASNAACLCQELTGPCKLGGCR